MARKVPLPPVTPINSMTEFATALGKGFALALSNPEAVPGMHQSQGNPVPLAPRIPEASVMVDKLVGNATNAGERWLANVQRPKKEPLKEALKANTKYKNAMQASIAGDHWAKGIQATDEAQMYATIAALGSGAFTQGIVARKGKIQAKFDKMRPLMVTLANQLDAMPTDTDAQREAKMIAAKRGMQALGVALKSK